MVKLVDAIRNFCVNIKHEQIDVKDGTGLVQVILWRKKKNVQHSVAWLTNVTVIVIFL